LSGVSRLKCYLGNGGWDLLTIFQRVRDGW
jgi:hypothetical protein